MKEDDYSAVRLLLLKNNSPTQPLCRVVLMMMMTLLPQPLHHAHKNATSHRQHTAAVTFDNIKRD